MTTPSDTNATSTPARRHSTAHALEALRCEQELIECHDGERGPLLLDAAKSWFDAGHTDRAVELLTEARLIGGDAGRTAQLHLARIAFDRGHRHEALGTLRWLADKAALDPFDLVGGGDLLRENGEPKEAVEWYDRVLAGQTPHQLTRPDCPWVLRTAAAGRARARADLGLPPDRLDQTTPPDPARATPEDIAATGPRRTANPDRTTLRRAS